LPLNRFTEFSTGFQRLVGRCPLVAALLVCLLTGWLVGPQRAIAADERAPLGSDQLIQRAEAGDPWAQLNLGAAYDNGMGGFPLDPVRAVKWYRIAAEAGLAEAQFNLAHCLATGNGTRRSDSEALTWMLRAAEQGLASAQYLAGVMYLEGLGTPVDRDHSYDWLRRASAAGNLDAGVLLQREFGDDRQD
jgi:TPR repeat protein